MKKFILTLFLLSLIIACAEKSDDNNSVKQPDTPCGVVAKCLPRNYDPKVNIQLEGQPYFEQFIFQQKEIEDDGPRTADVKYIKTFLGAHQNIELGQVDGKKKSYSLNVVIFKDGSSRYTYREFLTLEDNTVVKNGCKEVDGRWDVQGSILELRTNGILHLTGTKTKYGIAFKIQKGLLSKVPPAAAVQNLFRTFSDPMTLEESVVVCD